MTAKNSISSILVKYHQENGHQADELYVGYGVYSTLLKEIYTHAQWTTGFNVISFDNTRIIPVVWLESDDYGFSAIKVYQWLL